MDVGAASLLLLSESKPMFLCKQKSFSHLGLSHEAVSNESSAGPYWCPCSAISLVPKLPSYGMIMPTEKSNGIFSCA